MSATPDSTLANPEQLIADLQRQLAEREAELAEAREQQAATAEVLQVINSSSGDLAPVFDVILKKAHALCGSNHGALFLCDGERFLPAAMSDPELLATPLRQGGMGSDAPLVRPLLAGEPFAHIIDLTLVDHPLARAAVAKGVRTLLSIPLRKDGTLVGMINAARFEVHPFSEKQIVLLQNFATQAVIAIENARLLTETREALEQQTATAEVLQVINSSPGDLAPVFDAMLEKATRLCEAPFGILRIWDGERFHFGAVHGEPEFSDWVRRRHPIQPDRDNSPLGRILQGEQIVHVADVSSDESSRTSTGFREMIMESGLRSSIMVALRKEDAFVGTITVYRQEVRPFSDKQIALLENFAAQAVIAMENARLITETREALEQQTATAEVLGVINSSPGDLQPVFETMLERAIRLCEADEGLLTNRDREEYEITANRSRRPQMVSLSKGKRFQANRETVIGRVALEGRTIHLADVNADPDYRNPEMAREALPGTLLGVPLLREGLVVGTFSLARERIEAFTDKQIALVENFAAQAVIAMENARLLTETREALRRPRYRRLVDAAGTSNSTNVRLTRQKP